MRFYFAAVSLALVGCAVADSCPAGQYITFNQFTFLNQKAPQCWRTGCGDSTGNMTMSSTCQVGSPCYQLWNILRPWWQKENEWCKSCASDKACWLTGWPVLNATHVCNLSPNVSLFANTATCCSAGNEPVELADFIGSMCNENQWRNRWFADTYGMALPDWLQHIRTINITVRNPKKNETTGYCDADQAADSTLRAMGIENIIDFFETAAEIVIFWVAIVWGTELGKKKVKSWKHALWEGIISGLFAVLANLGTVLLWAYLLNYHDNNYSKANYITTIWLLLCVRPGIVGYLCFLGLLAKPLEKPMAKFGKALRKLVLPVRTAWERLVIKMRLKKPKPVSLEQETADLDTINLNQARQFFANWALIIAFAELFMQALSFAAVFWHVNAGRERQFYQGVLRREYVRGSPALLLYAGALLHIMFWPISVAALLASSWVHLNRSRFQEALVKSWLIEWLFGRLEYYYKRRRIQEQEQQLPDFEHLQARRQQGFLKAILLSITGNPKQEGENAPMLEKDRHSSSQESSQDSGRMGWARRAFLSLRVEAVSRILWKNPGTQPSRKGKQKETSEARSVTRYVPYQTPPLQSPDFPPRNASYQSLGNSMHSERPVPAMAPAIRNASYQAVATDQRDASGSRYQDYQDDSRYYDLPLEVPSDHAEEDSAYYDPPTQRDPRPRPSEEPPAENDRMLDYRGFYEPGRQSPADESPDGSRSSPPVGGLPARWIRPEPSIASDAPNYETHGDVSRPPTGRIVPWQDPPAPASLWIAPSTPPRVPVVDPSAPPNPPRGLNNLHSRRVRRAEFRVPPFRLLPFILATQPFPFLLHALYLWLENARRRLHNDWVSRGRPEAGPSYEEYLELRKVSYEMDAQGLPKWRTIALWVTFVCVTVNYVSQWCFWAGFLRVMGDRWCPPDLEFKTEKLLWAAGNFLLVFFSAGFAVLGPGVSAQ